MKGQLHRLMCGDRRFLDWSYDEDKGNLQLRFYERSRRDMPMDIDTFIKQLLKKIRDEGIKPRGLDD